MLVVDGDQAVGFLMKHTSRSVIEEEPIILSHCRVTHVT